MNRMKILMLYIAAFVSLVLSSSCRKGIGDYLEKPPGVDITIDTIFSSEANVETFIASLYHYGLPLPTMPPWDDERGRIDGSIAAATDEAEVAMSWYWTNNWNVGNMSANNILDLGYNNRWRVIRMANTIIENIDAAPFSDPAFKSRVKGEALFMRAFSYLEFFQRYGGVPLVKKVLTLGDTLKTPRSTVAETVDFIVEDCKRASRLLPASYPSNMRGHANKGAALMVMSRTLLYAASPQFNTATPYMDLGENNDLICYGNYDESRWQLAADAAKSVLDWAKNNRFHLITDKGIYENEFYVWEHPDNPEVILAQKGRKNAYMTYQQIWKSLIPSSFGGPGGTSVTLNFIKKFEKKDGTPQVWNMNGGNNLMDLYRDLDPRFAQSCAYNTSYWNSDHPYMELWQGGKDELGCITGVFLRKPVPRQLTKNVHPIANEVEFRLAEAYLNYAEALNEANPAPVPAAYRAVDSIRLRSGMPPFPSGLSKEEFRERIRNERTIERAFEGGRLWDVRRWLIARDEGVMNGAMWGIKIYKIDNNHFSYEPYVFENRVFSQRMYLNPFPQTEVNKGYLVQNPGY